MELDVLESEETLRILADLPINVHAATTSETTERFTCFQKSSHFLLKLRSVLPLRQAAHFALDRYSTSMLPRLEPALERELTTCRSVLAVSRIRVDLRHSNIYFFYVLFIPNSAAATTDSFTLRRKASPQRQLDGRSPSATADDTHNISAATVPTLQCWHCSCWNSRAIVHSIAVPQG